MQAIGAGDISKFGRRKHVVRLPQKWDAPIRARISAFEHSRLLCRQQIITCVYNVFGRSMLREIAGDTYWGQFVMPSLNLQQTNSFVIHAQHQNGTSDIQDSPFAQQHKKLHTSHTHLYHRHGCVEMAASPTSRQRNRITPDKTRRDETRKARNRSPTRSRPHPPFFPCCTYAYMHML